MDSIYGKKPEEYAWHSEDPRDRAFSELMIDDMVGFVHSHTLSGLLVLMKENFTDPPEPEPHFLHSYKLGSVRCGFWTGGIGRVRPSGARITQDYIATANGDGYRGAVTVLVCPSYNEDPAIAKKAALYAFDHYKIRIEEAYPEWATDYQGEPLVETDIEWTER
jgi:hypothetical protein